MPVCTRCGQDNPEVARFCLACGAPLASPEPAREERKLITVLFCDIVGSTAKAEQMDPEDVRARLAPYYARVRAELDRFGGTVEKFIGDAVVALFGAPVAHEDDPERAVRAAIAICEAIDDLNASDDWLDLQIRIGVNTGEALVVVGARATEGEGMAAGDVMNTAARLQSAAPVNGVLVGAETYRATHRTIAYADVEPIAAKGKAEAVPVWRVVGVADHRQRGADQGEFVGRDEELQRLLDAWLDVRNERRARLVGVVGEPGMGKSRLLSELTERIQSGANVHRGRCLSYGEGITYWPITELLKSAAGILQSDARDQVAEKLDRLLARLPTEDPDELRTLAAAVSNVLGIPTTPRGTYAAAEIAQSELHWGIRRAAQLLALEQPTILVVEDLHWAEPTLIELIEFIATAESEAPLLLIWTARPELVEARPEFANGPGSNRVELQVLPERAGTELLAALIGDAELANSPFGAALIANAGGNPLFLEETVRMLRDEGWLDAARWHDAAAVETLPVPANLQALISSRLDRLEAGAKDVAHDASVIGNVFWAGAVGYLGAGTVSAGTDPRPQLATLVRQDFVRPNPASSVSGEDEYAFKHILIRDVAYGQVPKGRRAQLHLRFSDWVTTLRAAADEFVEIVAWHLEQACRLSREVARSPIDPPLLAAAGALANAAGRAERREGLREAARYYTRALDVLGAEYPDQALELRLRRADIMTMLGELKEACEELVDVIDAASRSGNARVECEGLLLLGDADQRQGRAADAAGRLADAELLTAAVADPTLTIKVSFVLSALRADFHAEHDRAVADLRNAVALAQEVGDKALAAEGHLRASAILINAGHLADAETELRSCLALAGEMGSHRLEAEATCWLGTVKWYRGELEEAERLCKQADEWFERTGDTYFQVQNVAHHGLATFALADGRCDEAESALREILPVALQIGGWVMIETYRQLVAVLVAQGHVDDARELLAFAARSLPDEDPYARACLLLAEGAVATASGESTAAATAYAEALRVVEELNLPLELGEVRHALARSLQTFGDVTGARTEYERARVIFSRAGAVTPRDRIDAELAELVEGPAPAGPSTT